LRLFFALLLLLVVTPAMAQQKMRVGVFNVSTALPYYVAIERGYFADAGLQVETVPLQTPTLIVQAMVTSDLQATSNLVTLEGANIDHRRPGTAVYFTLNGQNAKFRMEQFLVRPASPAKTLADLKGARIESAPGPANLAAARGVLAAVGLQDKIDYTLSEQQLGNMIGAMQSGNFDAAYALEPIASIAESNGIARLLEAGVISRYILGRPDAETFASGAAMTRRFITEQPAAAQAFAAAWAHALQTIATDPTTRALLVKYLNTPPTLAPTLPLQDMKMVATLDPADIADFQKFVDFGVQQGLVQGPIDVTTMLQKF
jgi:NitT/TauT family transport system substrate-binding protein